MKKRKLEDRLFPVIPKKNGVGRFIPYCNYERHKGVIIGDYYKHCERQKSGRGCPHYLRLYLTYRERDKLKNIEPKRL